MRSFVFFGIDPLSLRVEAKKTTLMSRYIRQEEIGRGTWGVVYKAIDTFTGTVVAIKELSEEAGLPRQEVALAQKITHVNVCRIGDYVETPDGKRFITMEFVDGGNLRTLLEKSGPVPLGKALSIARQILDGLEELHRNEIVHRDLKP